MQFDYIKQTGQQGFDVVSAKKQAHRYTLVQHRVRILKYNTILVCSVQPPSANQMAQQLQDKVTHSNHPA